MVKTKQAMKVYTCSQCEDTIQKGDRVGRRSVITGYYGTGGKWSVDVPMREILPVCFKCSQ